MSFTPLSPENPSGSQTETNPVAALVATARWMAARGLAWGSSGNISARDGEDAFWLSATGTWFERMAAGDFVRCRISDGSWEGTRKPSKEIGMHRAIYAQRPDARWLLHCTPPQATVFVAQHRVPARGVFVEGMAYAGHMAEVGYFHPGSAELGAAIGQAAEQANTLLLQNHGVFVFDAELDEARMRLLSLEFACGLELAAGGTQSLAPLPEAVIREFEARRIYRPLPKCP